MKHPVKWSSLFDPMFRRRTKNYIRRKLGSFGNVSYAQLGEDIILRNLFDIIGVANPTYLDIGAHHPKYLSNTYLFYRQGSRGVCIEPDPSLITHFKRVRPHDISLAVGVADQPGELIYFVMSSSTLNTFSEKEALNAEDLGHRIIKRLRIPVITVNEAFERFERTPDLVSIDIEGMEESVITCIDFKRFRPTAVCVETLTYSEAGEGEKKGMIFQIFAKNGFFPFADTHVNTIFVEESRWRKKK